MARKPREGSRAWEATLAESTTYAKNTILSLAQRAEGGDKEAFANLLQWLEKYPDMRSLVRGLDDLATKVVRAWVERLGGANALHRKGIEDEVAALKAELLGDAPSVTDKILVAAVVVAYLSHQRAAYAASQPTEKPEVRAARERLLALTQKRLQDALKGWELHAGKKARGLRPGRKLKLFDPDAA
jgi:hypothetical protein